MKKNAIFPTILILLSIFLSAASTEAGNIIKIGDDITIERDQKVNTVIVIGGQATVHGLVENNIFVAGGSVVLTSTAVVRGNVICMAGVIVQGNGSQVFGDITEINTTSLSNAFSSAFRGELEGWSLIFNIISVCFFAVIFFIALLVTILIPRPLIVVADKIRNYRTKSFIWGFLATLMIAPFFMLLVFSIIGITLIPLIFTLLLLAFIFGYIAAGKIIGSIIITKIFSKKIRSLVGETILGLIILWLAGWIPYIGWLFKVLALTFGLGGVLLTLFSRKEQPPIGNEQFNG